MVAQETLPTNYGHVISHFANSWYVLCDKFNLSTTVKCHIILDHLEEQVAGPALGARSGVNNNITHRNILKK